MVAKKNGNIHTEMNASNIHKLTSVMHSLRGAQAMGMWMQIVTKIPETSETKKERKKN